VPPVLQLHGSFTWRFAVPTKAERLRSGTQYSNDAIWIPPAVLKESKSYPFNKVIGLSYELLARQCDVLRVIGSSLTQNDWNVLCLIFNGQRHREAVAGTAFRIELIMPLLGCSQIGQQCSYLKNLTPIDHLSEGDFDVFREDEPDSETRNTFAYWLKQKIQYHHRRGEFGTGTLSGLMAQVAGEAS